AQHSAVRLAALQFRDVLAGRVALRGQVSSQWYARHWSFGPTGAALTERNREANLDAVWPLGHRQELSFGVNARHLDTESAGHYAADSTDLLPGAPTRLQSSRPVVEYPGFYLEDKLRLWGPVYATLGSRLDWASTPGVWTSDPRGALAWKVDGRQTVRVAAGRYHELADPRFLDPVYGNPRLAPLTADHAVTLVARYQVNTSWQLGAKYNYSAGRPVTPVVGRSYDPVRGIWHPVYGENDSDRLPDYHRLDVRVTRLFSLPALGALRASSVCVLYLEGMNVLGLRNAQDYVYNSDYSERRTVDSVFSRRLLVAGCSLTW